MIRIPSVGSPESMTEARPWLSADGGLDGGAGWDWAGRGWAVGCADVGWAGAGWA
jgi:hypothetical protein